MAGACFCLGIVCRRRGGRDCFLLSVSFLVALRFLVRLDGSGSPCVSRSLPVGRRLEGCQHHIRFLHLRTHPIVGLDYGSDTCRYIHLVEKLRTKIAMNAREGARPPTRNRVSISHLLFSRKLSICALLLSSAMVEAVQRQRASRAVSRPRCLDPFAFGFRKAFDSGCEYSLLAVILRWNRHFVMATIYLRHAQP